MRLIARFSKLDEARFVSHLDIQRLFGRAFRRAGISVSYSQGFNPHPVLSFATALSTGIASRAEWLDVRLDAEMKPQLFVEAVNTTLPAGFIINEAYEVEDKLPALTALLAKAEYFVYFIQNASPETLQNALEQLLASPIVINKRTKSGIKPFDMRPQVLDAAIITDENGAVQLRLTGVLNAGGSLNADAFTQELLKAAQAQYDYRIDRSAVFFTNGSELPF